MSQQMDMARVTPVANIDPVTGYGFDAAGNAVCMSPTLVRSGYLGGADDNVLAHAFGVDQQNLPYMVVIDGDDERGANGEYGLDDGDSDLNGYEPARVAHAPGIGGHYWPAGASTPSTNAAMAPAPVDGIGRQIAGMLESLAGLDSDVAAAAAAMFAPTAVLVDDGTNALQGQDVVGPRVSHMRMPGAWTAPDAIAVRGRLPTSKARMGTAAPTDTESAGDTYTVERTANVVYYDNSNDDDDNDDDDNDRDHNDKRQVAHSQAYAPAASSVRRQRRGPAPTHHHAPPSSSSSSSSSTASSSCSTSSSSFFSGTTFGTSRTTASSTSPSSSFSSSSESSSSSSCDDSVSRPQRQRRRRRDPCSPSSGNTVSISSISAPWASAFSTVSTGVSSSLSDSTVPERARRTRRRPAPKRRARHVSADDSSATDVGEMHRMAKHLVALARTGSAGDETDDGDTVDPHAVASRARHNRR
ncbi:hypothetical protein pneo_cds_192 [Pandoravirus neocaledonia]|uniref:Uncharacterized protein n=1 Tax=Pandoravirus neocaledonia TaxID=2107708 RepID=A0A2U7UBG0_9VIRU|nr:hypothetical protein pneo_cds_192 [Pandoravirus neocaledonia]AVK75799.1 hypothetical protein pneo_cds_192 [Pandoravirus neocaledonia]